MASFTLDGLNTLSGLADRNLLATMKISQIAALHGAGDAIIGGVGSIIPGMGPVALVTAMSLQLPVYQGLVMDLGRIYNCPTDRLTNYRVFEGAAIGATGMLAAEFGVGFLKEIAPGILAECGFGFLTSMIPFVGIAVGATLDFAIAATMTWRVGTMAAIYFQNGQNWVGSRKATYKMAKGMTGGVAPSTENRVDFGTIPGRVSAVNEHQVETAIGLIRMLRKMKPDATEEFLRNTMMAQGLPETPTNEALRRTRGKAA